MGSTGGCDEFRDVGCQLSVSLIRLMFIMCAGHQSSTIAGLAGVVAVVASVPAFAQSNSGYSAVLAIDRTSGSVVREYVPRETAAAVPPSIPSNLILPSSFEPLLKSMLERSPTFRRQCRRIAYPPNLSISVQTAGLSALGSARARATIVRRNETVEAAIQVLYTENPIELIAHELEHIIEQLDGIDLAARAAISTSGVHPAAGDRHTFETTRARRVGLAVAAEVRAGGG